MSKQPTDNHFKDKFAVVKQQPQPSTGPWRDEQPLKAKPKQFDAHDPDRMGG